MLHALLALLITSATFTPVVQAAESTRTYILTTLRRIQVRIDNYPTDPELARNLSQAMGQQVRKPSREFYLMTQGAMAISQTQPANFDTPHSPAMNQLLTLSAQRQLQLTELTGPFWVHLLKPIDDEEEQCLWLVKVNNRYTGCGDPWHDGLTPNEVVCIDGRTYLKCHIDCIKRIHRREGAINDQLGFCPGVAP